MHPIMVAGWQESVPRVRRGSATKFPTTLMDIRVATMSPSMRKIAKPRLRMAASEANRG